MAISDTQKVDLLYKKIAWAATKTDTNPPKEAYNEANPSPLLIRGDTLWQLSGSIPASIPATTSSVVQVYKDGGGAGYTATVECTELAVTDNRTWSTGLTNWIDPQFGSTYFAKVYVDTAGSTTPQTTGTSLQAAGLNDDQWYFDYQSGILNFIGSNLPASIATGITGKSVFVSGARYIGPTGVVTWSNGLTIGNITISGNTISSTGGNISLSGISNLSATGSITAGTFTGNVVTDYISANTGTVVTITGNGALAVPVGNIASRPTGKIGDIRFNSEISVNTLEFYDGTQWIPFQNSITDQQITPDGTSTSYVLTQAAANAESLLVSINGTVQRPGAGSAYTVSGGNIVFAEAPAATDIIDIRYIASATSTSLVNLSSDIGTSGNISAGNISVTNGLFWSNGTNYSATLNNYTNANVAAYLPTYSGNITAMNVTVSASYSSNVVVTNPNVSIGSTSPTVVDYFSANIYRSTKYSIQSSAGSSFQVNDLWVMQDGAQAYITATGATTTANLGIYSAVLTGSNVQLYFTPVNSNTQLRIYKTQFII